LFEEEGDVLLVSLAFEVDNPILLHGSGLIAGLAAAEPHKRGKHVDNRFHFLYVLLVNKFVN
jgi:hypothetical protein